MLPFLAERWIEEAVSRGEFDNLPGAGRPLELDDIHPLLPEELPAREIDGSAERAKARNKLAGYFALLSCSEMARLRSLYSLQPKKQILSSDCRCSFALATLPTIR